MNATYIRDVLSQWLHNPHPAGLRQAQDSFPGGVLQPPRRDVVQSLRSKMTCDPEELTPVAGQVE